MIEASDLTYRYGKHLALDHLSMSVPDGSLYALLGPNGSGKTTLLQILMGLRKEFGGTVRVNGKDVSALSVSDRSRISYIAEGQRLPEWMTLTQLEAYLAPLYPTWDRSLATELREQFELDPARRIGRLSRGERMKAALLTALAPRPKLLIMDEPFTGMDALVKDELVRGLLQSSGSEGWTVLLCSHDIGELELLADSVGLLDRGKLRLSTTMDDMRSRFHRIEAVLPSDARVVPSNEWLAFERSLNRITFTVDTAGNDVHTITSQLPSAARIETREATLREVFIALARRKPAQGVAA